MIASEVAFGPANAVVSVVVASEFVPADVVVVAAAYVLVVGS